MCVTKREWWLDMSIIEQVERQKHDIDFGIHARNNLSVIESRF